MQNKCIRKGVCGMDVDVYMKTEWTQTLITKKLGSTQSMKNATNTINQNTLNDKNRKVFQLRKHKDNEIK